MEDIFSSKPKRSLETRKVFSSASSSALARETETEAVKKTRRRRAVAVAVAVADELFRAGGTRVAPDLFFCAKAFCLMDACTVTK